MGFCKQCGTEYAEGQTFCKECGVPIKGKQEVPLSQSEQRKPWKKSHKILLITALLLMGGLYAGHEYMKSLYTPDKTVESFAAAVSKADVKRAEKIMDLDSIKQGKDEKGMKSYLAYLDTDLPYLTDQLEEHA
ncbi:zinc-ribbon domain-containing protein [Rossellomorea marisflavi]|uniref:TcaA second domain-containing protein n=1 Tax=Rossellomorea marisflavi TaxID=189381 RepID=UPI003D2873E9